MTTPTTASSGCRAGPARRYNTKWPVSTRSTPRRDSPRASSSTFSRIHRARRAGCAPATSNTASTIHGSTITHLSSIRACATLRAAADNLQRARWVAAEADSPRQGWRFNRDVAPIPLNDTTVRRPGTARPFHTPSSLSSHAAAPEAGHKAPITAMRKRRIDTTRYTGLVTGVSCVSRRWPANLHYAGNDPNEVGSQTMTASSPERFGRQQTTRPAGWLVQPCALAREHHVLYAGCSRRCFAHVRRFSPKLSDHGVSVKAASRAAGLRPPTRRSTWPSPASCAPPVTPAPNCCRSAVLCCCHQYQQHSQGR